MKWFIGVAAALLPSVCQAASIVTNGDFESPVVTGFQNGQGQTDTDWYNANQTFGGWKVESGSIDLVRSPRWQVSSGSQAIDLSGQNAGIIYQDLATVVGQKYILSFLLAGNPETPNFGGSLKHLAVFWNGAVAATPTFDTTGFTISNLGWTPVSFEVTATGDTTRLRFQSLDSSNGGPALDNISVVVAPEPSAIGVVAIAGFVLRRNRRTHALRAGQ